MLTKQKAFDIVAKHLFAQGERSVGQMSCQYRAIGGMKCAIGALIPDAEYKAEFEPLPVQEVAPDVPALAGLDIDFLAALQEAHDHKPNWDADAAMKAALLRVSRRHGLSDAILDGLSFGREAAP